MSIIVTDHVQFSDTLLCIHVLLELHINYAYIVSNRCYQNNSRSMELLTSVFSLVSILIFRPLYELYLHFYYLILCVLYESLHDVNKGVKAYDCLNVKKNLFYVKMYNKLYFKVNKEEISFNCFLYEVPECSTIKIRVSSFSVPMSNIVYSRYPGLFWILRFVQPYKGRYKTQENANPGQVKGPSKTVRS